MAEHLDTLIAAGRIVAHGEGREAAIAVLRESAAGDIDPLLRAAESHGMLPILCRVLEAQAADAMTGRARERVARERRLAGVRALAAIAQLGEALTTLERAGIRAMPYKGPALSIAAYGEAALRSSDDIDLLVDPADVEGAWIALSAIGYRAKEGWSWRRWRAANAWQGQVALFGTGDRLTLDLHWRTCDEKLPWNVPLGELWVHSHEIELAGGAAVAPDVAGQLTLVLLHAARHGWDRLEYLLCTAALLKRDITPERAISVIRRPGARVAVAAGLFAVSLLFDDRKKVTGARLGLPDLTQGMHDLAVAALRSVRAGDAGASRSARLHLRSLDGPLDRAQYIALAALQPTAIDYESARLPDALSFAYPLVRLARLAARG